MLSWLSAILHHSLCLLQNLAAHQILSAPESDAFHIGCHALSPKPCIRDSRTGEARRAASGMFPFSDDFPDDFFCSGFVQIISSGQRCVIRFRHLALATST
jgi:hypothetical protein